MEESKYVTKVQNWDRSAEKWYSKSKEDKYINGMFIPFIFEFIAFNALYSDMTYHGRNTDRNKIKGIKKIVSEDSEISKDFLDKLREIYDNFNDKEMRELKVSLKCKNPRSSYWDIEKDGEKKGKTTNGIIVKGRHIEKKDIKNVIEFIYRVRNNLVHGFKDCLEPRDKILTNIAFKFLSNLVKILLKPQNFKKLKIKNLN